VYWRIWSKEWILKYYLDELRLQKETFSVLNHHHHHHWLDSPTWALAFLRNFCQLKYSTIASSDFVTKSFFPWRGCQPRTQMCLITGDNIRGEKSKMSPNCGWKLNCDTTYSLIIIISFNLLIAHNSDVYRSKLKNPVVDVFVLVG
jgi:hypothetical protein